MKRVNGQRRDENQGILRDKKTMVIEFNNVLAFFVIAQFIVGMRMRREAAAVPCQVYDADGIHQVDINVTLKILFVVHSELLLQYNDVIVF